MLFNPEGRGLRKVMRERDEKVIRILWREARATSDLVKETGLRREDVLRILGELHEQGVVDVTEDYTMGSRRDIWSAKFDEAGFRRLMVRRILRSLLEDWPEAKDVIIELLGEAGRGP